MLVSTQEIWREMLFSDVQLYTGVTVVYTVLSALHMCGVF